MRPPSWATSRRGPDADSDRETPVTGVEGTGPDGDIDGDDAVIIGNSPEDGDDTADIPAEPGAADARTPETKPGDTTASESETEADVEGERPAMTAGQS